MIQHAQGWADLSDTQLLGEDPVFQLTCSDQRSITPLLQQRSSQPTLSRLLNLLAQDANLTALHNGLLDLAMWRLASMRGGKPLPSITLDVDGLPIETFGSQAGTDRNRYYVVCYLKSRLVQGYIDTQDLNSFMLSADQACPAWSVVKVPIRQNRNLF